MPDTIRFITEKFMEDGFECVRLAYRHTNPAKCAEAVISPLQGSNLIRFIYGGHRIIDSNPAAVSERLFAGTPVLFPAPNRMRNARFTFEGRTVAQTKHGQPVVLHSLVHNEPWQYGEPTAGADSAKLTTWIDFEEGNHLCEGFPFPCRLTLEFTLMQDAVSVVYTVDNLGSHALPFGFALHPYFEKLSGENGTIVTLPARSVMDATSDLLPTGRLIDVENTTYDLRNGIAVGRTDMDHVFTGIAPGAAASIEYRTLGFKVELRTSDDFTHLVYYSPKGAPFFCVENQTCSTDAHNLYDRGFVKESHLMVAKPGESMGGSVTFTVVPK